ncbi:MAG: PAS domain S-box protein, partial [Burkholderiaceae bacterium]
MSDIPIPAPLRRQGPARARKARAAPAPDAALEGELAQLRALLAARTAELEAALAVKHATLESTADGILITDEHGRVVAHNEKYLQLWGLARAEVDAALHADLIGLAQGRSRHPASLRERLAQIQALPSGETLDRVELAGGRVLEQFSSAHWIAGRRAGRVWSYRDITAQLRAEDALRDDAGVFDFLNRTGATMAATLDIATLMQTVIDAATQVSGAAFGAFFHRAQAQAADAGETMCALAGPAPPPPDRLRALELRAAAL